MDGSESLKSGKAEFKSFSTYLNILISHTDVVGICRQVFWSGHDGKLNGSFVTKRLVCPLSHRADLFDRRDAIVGNQDLPIRQS